MLRKLVIIGSIAALFILTAAPAFGLTLNDHDGQGSRTPIDIGDPPESNPAHGPLCGAGGPTDCGEVGVDHLVPGLTPSGLLVSRGDGGTAGPLPFNVGAWNAVFGPGGMSNTNTPICGIRDEPLVGLDDGTFGTNNCVTN
jgi:hypothetical protein